MPLVILSEEIAWQPEALHSLRSRIGEFEAIRIMRPLSEVIECLTEHQRLPEDHFFDLCAVQFARATDRGEEVIDMVRHAQHLCLSDGELHRYQHHGFIAKFLRPLMEKPRLPMPQLICWNRQWSSWQ